MDATGAVPAAITACISRPAITRASTTASRTASAWFEPGTQGEHKIARGFVPTETWSAHWLSHPQFTAAIDDYLDRERDYIDEYIDAVNEHVPYRKDSD